MGCKGCHSPYLAEDLGEVLDEASLERLITANPGISCVSLMGGDADPAFVASLCRSVKAAHPGLKTCWYSGRGLDKAGEVLPWLDFIKVGPWIAELGPLDSETTNQRFYAIFHDGPAGNPTPSPAPGSPAGIPSGLRLEDRTARVRKIFL